MIVWEFSTCFNTLVVYAPEVLNMVYGRIKMFVLRLWADLVKKVMEEDHAFTTYSEALNKALKAKIMLDRMQT